VGSIVGAAGSVLAEAEQAVTKLSGEPEYERHRIAFSPLQRAKEDNFCANRGFRNSLQRALTTEVLLRHKLLAGSRSIPYWSRKATMGSMRAARRAGSQLASNAISTMVVVMPANTMGSSGRTPRSRLLTSRARA